MMTKRIPNASTANSGGRKFKNDLIFIVSLVLVLALVGAAFFFFRGEGDVVRVTVDGELYGSYPLSEDVRVEIVTGEDGEAYNVLVIRDGVAYVESASCPDGICADHKPIRRDGESIVCLPNRVVITVDTSDGEEQPDLIV